jgi:parvulin-like peptidyl-prolyl isomerase
MGNVGSIRHAKLRKEPGCSFHFPMLINGEFVDDALVRLEAAQLKERMRAETNEGDALGIELRARETAREMIIERTVLRQAAQKDPRPIPSAAVESALAEYYKQSPQQSSCLLPRDQEMLRSNIEVDLRIGRFLAATTQKVPKPTGKQISNFYQYAKDSLLEPERIHAAHIVKNVDESTSESDALVAIRHIQSLLQNGQPFEQVADEHSDCPGRGGDLGFFPRGEMVAEFDAAVFALPAGSMSEIFRTPFGFHIAKVYERKAERVPSLNEIRPHLEESMWRQAKDQALRGAIDELRAQAEVRKSK